MWTWFVAMLLAAAGTGEARAHRAEEATFCGTLRSLLAAARERPAFASLDRRGLARAAAGLGFDTCGIEAGLYGNRLICVRNAVVRLPTGPAPDLHIAHCVPEALRMREAEGSRLARFRLGTLALHAERLPRTVQLRLFALPVER